jgi:hypothetical protein
MIDEPTGRDGSDAPEGPGDPLADPIVRRAVDQAVEPYRSMVSEEDLRAMRAALADMLVMHPVTDRLIRTLRPRAQVKSGEERTGPPDAPAGDGAASRREVG